MKTVLSPYAVQVIQSAHVCPFVPQLVQIALFVVMENDHAEATAHRIWSSLTTLVLYEVSLGLHIWQWNSSRRQWQSNKYLSYLLEIVSDAGGIWR